MWLVMSCELLEYSSWLRRATGLVPSEGKESDNGECISMPGVRFGELEVEGLAKGNDRNPSHVLLTPSPPIPPPCPPATCTLHTPYPLAPSVYTHARRSEFVKPTFVSA